MIAIDAWRKLPENCAECPLCDQSAFFYFACGQDISLADIKTYSEHRHEACPLREVPDAE